MRTKNHHLKLRGSRWYLRYDLPRDIRDCYTARKARTVEEPLHISDVAHARKLRDVRLRELEVEWSILRRQKRSQTKSDPATGHSPTAAARSIRQREALLDRLYEDAEDGWIGFLDVPLHEASQDDIGVARAAYAQTREGSELLRKINIARGDQTPLAPLCEEWLATKNRTASVMSDYRKALSHLCDRFSMIEEIDHISARRFLAELLQEKARPTVQKYTTAYRGVWNLKGLPTDQWTIVGMDSAVATLKRSPWTDDEYLRLLREAALTGNRQMWLAIRIAAHTGAAAQGIAGLEVREEEAGRISLYLPETKKQHRSRLIPCHPAILEDAREWVSVRLKPQPLSKQFGRLKEKLGFGPEQVLHGFRHSVANRLERAGIRGETIKRLLGHKLNDITFDTYSADGPGYDVLNEAVGKLRWPEIEWEPKKQGRA